MTKNESDTYFQGYVDGVKSFATKLLNPNIYFKLIPVIREKDTINKWDGFIGCGSIERVLEYASKTDNKMALYIPDKNPNLKFLISFKDLADQET